MDDAQNRLWFVTGEIDDYFRRLGCAGYQPGYQNWHVAALLLLAITHRNDTYRHHFETSVRGLISDWMWEQTNGLPARVIALIGSMTVTDRDLAHYTADIATRRSFRYGSNEREGWTIFLMRYQDATTEQLAA